MALEGILWHGRLIGSVGRWRLGKKEDCPRWFPDSPYVSRHGFMLQLKMPESAPLFVYPGAYQRIGSGGNGC